MAERIDNYKLALRMASSPGRHVMVAADAGAWGHPAGEEGGAGAAGLVAAARGASAGTGSTCLRGLVLIIVPSGFPCSVSSWRAQTGRVMRTRRSGTQIRPSMTASPYGRSACEKSTAVFCLSVQLRPRARLDLEAFVDEQLLRLFDLTSSLELPVELDLDDLVALPEPEREPHLRVRFSRRPLPFFYYFFFMIYFYSNRAVLGARAPVGACWRQTSSRGEGPLASFSFLLALAKIN
jgi:hypothetical protein